MSHPQEILASERTRVASLSDVEWPEHAIIIADAGLPPSILDVLPDPITVDAGEALKTLASVEKLAERVLERRATRPMTIVAVGGGSIGDAVGFLASVLWRGVPLWHVPTTLLAMVDSAHGGKTAVNLASYKNQLGTFYAAKRVVLVDEIVAGLPIVQREEGLAELVKGLWLGDAEGVDLLDEVGVGKLAALPFSHIGESLMTLLERAIDVKLDVVARDPHETKGIRTLLNFGHTVAHALELSSGLSHGHAVAWGMWVAAEASLEGGFCTPEVARRLRRHVYPLLTPIGSSQLPEKASFVRHVDRDKKKVAGTLRSIVVRDAGNCEVVDSVSSHQWWRALLDAHRRWHEGTISIERTTEVEALKVHVPSSKSEVNRMLTIAAMRRGPTHVKHRADADDVAYLERALEKLHKEGPTEVDAGEGGTTLRFLLAHAATLPGATTIRARKRLLERPHMPLLEALRELGVRVTEGDDHFVVHGPLPTGPLQCSVAVDESSQYASALAMIAASGRPLRLRLEGHMVSVPYFAMTLELLRQAGLRVTETGTEVVLEPTDALGEELELWAAPDASSAVAWTVSARLGTPVEAPIETASLQPDRRIQGIMERVSTAAPGTVVEVDLSDSPDLAPVLVAGMSLEDRGLRITGAGHLRHKESNRIDDVVEALGEVGIEVVGTVDGLEVPVRPQVPIAEATWETRGDHRLGFAALVLTTRGARLRVRNPWVVTKSYPRFWHDARRLGWDVELSP